MTGRLARALLLFAIAGCWPDWAAAAVNAAVEPRILDELDTARLTIRATGSSQTQRLNLEALEEDFEVLTTQSASQFRSVNGEVESWVEYQIMLRPRRAGELTIPPIAVGGETTRPLTVRVRGLAPELQDAIDRMVFFETELTRNPVYVQAQTVMVRRLYYSSGAQIYSDLPGMPEIPDAVVMPIGETTSSAQVRDGQRYGVIEQRFAIFPERSGELTIPAISVTSSVRLQTGGRTRRSGVRVATEPMTLEVLPVPADYPTDQPWLPAEDLTITDEWAPADSGIDVGDPVRRTLSARVVGNVGSAIPPLEPALPEAHFRSYPEPPQIDNDAGAHTLRGHRGQTYSIIPTAPGAVNVPATEVVWWDVDTGEVRTARTPGRTLRITGTAVEPRDQAGEAAGAAEAPGRTGQPAVPPSDVDVRRDQVPWPGAERRRALWLTALAVVAGVLLAAWLLHGWLLRQGVQAAPTRRDRWRALKGACAGRDQSSAGDGRADTGGDAAAIQHALLAYLQAHYDTTQGESLQRFRQAGHGDVLDALNAHRYRPGERAAVDGRRVLEAVRDIRRRRHAGHDPLPALYD